MRPDRSQGLQPERTFSGVSWADKGWEQVGLGHFNDYDRSAAIIISTRYSTEIEYGWLEIKARVSLWFITNKENKTGLVEHIQDMQLQQ